ncbi:hypothetical protein KCP77_16485 [Salmonella enterica subsp. enterica]|nr:hypothetical protein KCP77_16485 [Salmonella enterica subsp. enterica]
MKKIKLRAAAVSVSNVCSEEGTKRLVRAAIEYAITPTIAFRHALVHKGNITERSSPKARLKTGATSWRATSSAVSLLTAVRNEIKKRTRVKRSWLERYLADAFLQQDLLRRRNTTLSPV